MSRIFKCGYCREVVAELAPGTRIKPLTCMLCQDCAKKVGAIVAEHKAAQAKVSDPFGGFAGIFGKKAGG